MAKRTLIRFGDAIPVGDVFPFIDDEKKIDGKFIKPEHNFQGQMVKMNSIRYKVFSEKGCKCVRCGVEGKHFFLERHEDNNGSTRFHLNLYATKTDGKEVLMTVDHIVPASKGGKRTFVNLQTMCYDCNVKKANKDDEVDKNT